MNAKINQEFKKLIPPMLPEEKALLEESLKKEGLREPLLTWKGWLIDGHNRLELCVNNGIKTKEKELEFKDEEEVKLWIIENQLGRRNISTYDRGVLELKQAAILKQQAKERQGTKTDIVPKLALSKDFGRTRDKLAKAAKTSHGTLDKIKEIDKKAPEELKDKIRENKISIHSAFLAIKREEIKQNPLPIPKIPKGKYNIIYADPPRSYKVWSKK